VSGISEIRSSATHWHWADAAISRFVPRIQRGERFALAMNRVFNLRMDGGGKRYIWQAADWPAWRYDLSALTGPLTEVSRAQGVLLGVASREVV